MTTPTDDNPDLLTVIAYMRAASGKEDELRDALTALIEPTTEEAGCVNYDLHVSIEDPGVFFFYENWESVAHLDTHFETPHVVDLVGKMGDLLDEDGLTVTRLRRIA